jgi:hypothetical protein
VHLPSVYRVIDLLAKIDPVPMKVKSKPPQSNSDGPAEEVKEDDREDTKRFDENENDDEDEWDLRLRRDDHTGLLYADNYLESKVVRFFSQNLRHDALALDNIINSFQLGENIINDFFLVK